MNQFVAAVAFACLAASAYAQEVEDLAVDEPILESLRRARDTKIAVDADTPLGRYLRTFNFVKEGQAGLEITQEVLDRAAGIRDYFSAPRHFPGKQILAEDTAAGRITHRAYVREALPGDRYRVEVEEVLRYNPDMSPAETRKVERVLTGDEIGRLNDPTRPLPGRQTYNGVVFDVEQDPVLREWLRRANEIVDAKFPDFRLKGAALEAQQKQTFLELQRIIAIMEHPARASPEFAGRMTELRADPFYGSRSNWAGSHLKYEHGICFEQAAVQWWLVNAAARRAGVRLQLINGGTLDGGGHGFNRVEFGTARKITITDPSWESDGQWWRKGDIYEGNLYKKADEAFRDKDWDRNRRVIGIDGERITPRPPVQDRAAAAARSSVKREAGGAAQFAAAYLVKEGLRALETRDPKKMKDAARQLQEPEFWGYLGAFTAAARATEFGLSKIPVTGVAKGLSRAALPLAAGMAAVQLLSGQASLQSVLISTGSFLAAGLAVNLVADSFIYPILFAAGPPGWIAAGVYTVAKLAVTLYLGEKLDGWINSLLSGGGLKGLFGGGPPKREGVKQKIDGIVEKDP